MTEQAGVGLRLVATIAALVRCAEPLETVLTSIAAACREALSSPRVTVWIPVIGEAGFQAVPREDDLPTQVVDFRAIQGSADTRSVVLTAGERRLGVLEIQGAGGQPPLIDPMLLDAVAGLVTLALVEAERARTFHLESTRQSGVAEAHRTFLNQILDSLPVGLYVIDRKYRIQAWNRKREVGTQGLMRADVVGRTVFDVLTRQPADVLRSEFDQVFETGKPLQSDIERTEGDRPAAFRIAKIPMRMDGQTVTHVLTVGEDITEARTTQRRVMQSEKLAAIGQLAAGIMHEINNPLATIGACATALDGYIAEEAESKGREYLEIIEREVHRCSRIVDGLLDFARPPDDAPPVTVGVNSLVEQTLFLLKHHKGFKRMVVHTDLGADLPPVKANTEQMIQVLMALMLNAVDAMEPGGALTVRTRAGRRDGEVVIEVQDTGIGMAAGELERIFEPFYTTKPPGRGTGLGLSICYGIVERHHGQLTVDSEPGRGSVFRVVLPATEADA